MFNIGDTAFDTTFGRYVIIVKRRLFKHYIVKDIENCITYSFHECCLLSQTISQLSPSKKPKLLPRGKRSTIRPIIVRGLIQSERVCNKAAKKPNKY